MFDFDYDANVGFIPMIAKLGQCCDEKASEEEVQELSEAVAEQGAAVAENSAAIADNTNAISENSSAIADNASAIANNASAISENAAAIADNASAIADNTGAISENSAAITDNAAAIADEVAAREAAVNELNDRIDNIQEFKMEVVDELPATGDAGTIYLVKDAGKDTYSEYVYANGAWEKLGSEVDLSEYAKKADVDALLEEEAAAREELAASASASAETLNEKIEEIIAESNKVVYAQFTKDEEAIDELDGSVKVSGHTDLTKEEIQNYLNSGYSVYLVSEEYGITAQYTSDKGGNFTISDDVNVDGVILVGTFVQDDANCNVYAFRVKRDKHVILNFNMLYSAQTDDTIILSGDVQYSEMEILSFLNRGYDVVFNPMPNFPAIVPYTGMAGGDFSINTYFNTAEPEIYQGNVAQQDKKVVLYVTKMATKASVDALRADAEASANTLNDKIDEIIAESNKVVYVQFTPEDPTIDDNEGSVVIPGHTDLSQEEITEYISCGFTVYLHSDEYNLTLLYDSAKGGNFTITENVPDDATVIIGTFVQNESDCTVYTYKVKRNKHVVLDFNMLYSAETADNTLILSGNVQYSELEINSFMNQGYDVYFKAFPYFPAVVPYTGMAGGDFSVNTYFNTAEPELYQGNVAQHNKDVVLYMTKMATKGYVDTLRADAEASANTLNERIDEIITESNKVVYVELTSEDPAIDDNEGSVTIPGHTDLSQEEIADYINCGFTVYLHSDEYNLTVPYDSARGGNFTITENVPDDATVIIGTFMQSGSDCTVYTYKVKRDKHVVLDFNMLYSGETDYTVILSGNVQYSELEINSFLSNGYDVYFKGFPYFPVVVPYTGMAGGDFATVSYFNAVPPVVYQGLVAQHDKDVVLYITKMAEMSDVAALRADTEASANTLNDRIDEIAIETAKNIYVNFTKEWEESDELAGIVRMSGHTDLNKDEIADYINCGFTVYLSNDEIDMIEPYNSARGGEFTLTVDPDEEAYALIGSFLQNNDECNINAFKVKRDKNLVVDFNMLYSGETDDAVILSGNVQYSEMEILNFINDGYNVLFNGFWQFGAIVPYTGMAGGDFSTVSYFNSEFPEIYHGNVAQHDKDVVVYIARMPKKALYLDLNILYNGADSEEWPDPGYVMGTVKYGVSEIHKLVSSGAPVFLVVEIEGSKMYIPYETYLPNEENPENSVYMGGICMQTKITPAGQIMHDPIDYIHSEPKIASFVQMGTSVSGEGFVQVRVSDLALQYDLNDLKDKVVTKAEATPLFNDISGAVDTVAAAVAAETSAREAAVAELHEEIVALPKFKILIVDELPAVGDNATFYLLANGSQAGNEYDEYVYVNNAWEKIGTQSLDLSEYAKTADVDAAIAEVNDTITTKAEAADLETLSGVVETNIYELESVDEKLAGLASANASLVAKDALHDGAISELNSGLTELDLLKASKLELESAIAGKEAEIYNLTKIVGDLGGAVTYELPGENGKSFNTLMGNNGTVKLTDDVTTGRFGPGITAKNAVKLNLNSHNLTVTGLTVSSAQPAIMSRGTQEITIGGKGTIDAGEGICIEANGADSVINLTGSTSVYRTDRSGGELVYCYAGTINITNGTFRNDGDDKKFLLNCYDANYRNGTAKIVVTGGKFYDFDPANNTAEGEGTSFVPAGYESVPSVVEEDGVQHTVYTVKKSA